MKVILVDDEPILLTHLEKLFKDIDGIQLIGMYSNPYQAIEAVLRDKPDVVFLDIEMPEINGIEVAEKIQNNLPLINIVFVTAYSEYAVKAFEINAVDYLLKPLNRNRLLKTVQRFQVNNNSKELPVQTPMVCCFQSFQFIDAQSQKLQVRWRTNKAEELFLFLLHNRQKPIRKEMILDLFWPETEWDRAYTHMYTTIYQIRKALKSANLHIKIKSLGESYILDLNGVKLDVDELEKGINQYPFVNSKTLTYHQNIMALYQGDYLAES
ncbi:response regulator [Lederbergia lenta]|uniref:Two-component response regulator n=1 Tax=Lederbergia lenta TaxID=1467 RepID=A0A2X4ZQU4_LEDLE|nr:response regulator [Lederbergia lenta]MEC2323111.1 response regulator [Lederbergia lenta]SQI62744.1 two-component response regulator [Lederbergia lenta]